MDPMSIVCGTSALLGQAAKVVKILYELHGTLKDAPLLLSSIMTECTIMRTTLCALEDMQNLRSNRISFVSEQVFNSFSMAVACCECILAVLEKDVATCLKAGKDPTDKDAVRSCRIILSKDHLQELLIQLRGQSQAITSLLTTWRCRNEQQMRQHEADNRDVLRGIARRVMRRYTDSQTSSRDSQSMTSFDRFDFDQELLAAPCYQRAIHYLRKMESRQTELGGLTSEPEAIGLGISGIPEDDDSLTPSTPIAADPSYDLNSQDLIKALETPTINVSHHIPDPTEPAAEESLTPSISVEDLTDNVPLHRSFMSKRRSMPPLYSQIQAVAMSPNALLGVVARSQRHRRSRSEGNETIAASSPITRVIPSPITSTFRDSAIFDADFTFETATKEDFNADFDEFWVLQAYREHYRTSPIPARKIVFLGDPCIRSLWSTVKAAPRDLEGTDDDDGKHYNLSVAIDDVNFDLHLLDMTGDHDDFAASILEPEAHIAVIAYAIENPYSLRDVMHKWVSVVQNIYPSLPIYILGWGPEARCNAPLVDWLHTMGQKPVTYEDAAAAFQQLRAEAFLEISADSVGDAVDLIEALSKTSVHLHHEELRGRTPIDFDTERNRLSQSRPLSVGELLPPKFSILTEEVLESPRTHLVYELDATPEVESDEFLKEVLVLDEDNSMQEEVEEPFSEYIGGLESDLEEARIDQSGTGILFDTSDDFDEPESDLGDETEVFSPTDDIDPHYKSDARPRKAMTHAPVLLRIDTGLSAKYRPKLIQISSPQRKADVDPPAEEPELTNWESCFQQYLLQEDESQEHSVNARAGLPSFEEYASFSSRNPEASEEDREVDQLVVPDTMPQPQDSPYILPDLPEFESFTPRLLDFLFETMPTSTGDHN